MSANEWPNGNETRFQRFKREAKAKGEALGGWLDRNKEMIIFLTPIVIGGVTTVCKVVGKRCNLHKEETLKKPVLL